MVPGSKSDVSICWTASCTDGSKGRPTAGDERLDADVILAAQALSVGGTVATTNIKHLSHYVPVEDWSNL